MIKLSITALINLFITNNTQLESEAKHIYILFIQLILNNFHNIF